MLLIEMKKWECQSETLSMLHDEGPSSHAGEIKAEEWLNLPPS